MEPEEVDAYTQQMRARALRELDSAVRFECIQEQPHREILATAIYNTISCELSIFTFAQIIDGLSIADVAWDQRLPGIFGDHPIEEHEDLCPGAIDRAREYLQDWEPSFLRFNYKVVEEYEKSDTSSTSFKLRLIELVAVALYQIGAELYKLKLELHQGDITSVVSWVDYDPDLLDVPPRPTLINHHAYLYDEVYPDGVADIVGYWSENCILGGVVVFDRKESAEAREANVYFHTAHEKVTYRLYQLRDEQQEVLLDFLLADKASDKECPLPILGDDENLVRMDAAVAIPYASIYRDVWERKPYTKEQLRFLAQRPDSDLNYPEAFQLMVKINETIANDPEPKGPPSSEGSQ